MNNLVGYLADLFVMLVSLCKCLYVYFFLSVTKVSIYLTNVISIILFKPAI